jgi:hypothetical protein
VAPKLHLTAWRGKDMWAEQLADQFGDSVLEQIHNLRAGRRVQWGPLGQLEGGLWLWEHRVWGWSDGALG